jgi:ankyrin repeat protein
MNFSFEADRYLNKRILNMKKLRILMLVTVFVGCGKKEETPANPETGSTQPIAKAPINADMEIFEACTKGNLKAVEAHIAGGTDLNQRGPDQITPLITAITFERLDVAKALIKGGAKLDLKNKDGTTALISAAFLGQPETVKLLLEKGADINAKNKDGTTALASAETPWELAKGILDFLSGFVWTPAGVTVDYEKIKAGRPVCAQILRDAGGNAAAPAGTSLIDVVYNEDLAAVKKLIAEGADVNMRKPDDGSTPLHIAVFVCNIEIVKELIAAKADVNAKNNKGDTPLSLTTVPMEALKPIYDFMGALTQKRFDLVRIAKDRVEVAKILGGGGNNPAASGLHDAVFGEDLAAVKKLIAGGANVNEIKPDDGSTPLHTAVFMCNIEIVQALIAAKADVNAKNKKGETSLVAATIPWETIKPGYDFLGPLLQKKFDLERIEKDRVKVAEILRTAGAK